MGRCLVIVLDTVALLFWMFERVSLSKDAARAIASADRIAVSSISIWEIGVKVNTGKLSIPLPVPELAERLERVDRLDLLAVDLGTWLMVLDLDWAHRDPADRTIVATAALLACPLLTPDSRIQKFYTRSIW